MTDAAGVGVNLEAVCGTQRSSKAEVSSSDEHEVGVNWKGSAWGTKLHMRLEVDVLAKNTFGQEGRRRFVFVKGNEGNLVADARQYTIMRPRTEKDYQGLQEIVECMNVKQKGLLTSMGRKQKLMSGAQE